MRASFTILMLWMAVSLVGQDTSYYYSIGTDGNDEAIYGAEVNGRFVVFGNTGQVGSGGSDIYILHFDEGFKVDSFSVIGSSANERLVDVATNSMGLNYLLVSYYDGYSETDYDYELIVLDSSFNELSIKLIEEEGTQNPIQIQVSNELIYVLSKTISGTDESSYSLTSFDFDLDKVDEFSIEGFDSLTVASFYIADDIVIFGSHKPIDSNNLDFIVLKYNVQGDLINQKSLGFKRNEIPESIYGYQDSTFFIVGSSNSRFDEDYDAFIGLMRLDEMELIWSKTLGWNPNVTNRDEFGINSVIGSNKNIYFGLTTESYGEGGDDFHCYELQKDGSYIQGNSFGLSTDEVLVQLIALADSSLLFLGNTESNNGGPSDVFIVRTKNIGFGNEIKFESIRDTVSIVDLVTSIALTDDQAKGGDFEVLQSGKVLSVLYGRESQNERVRLYIYGINGNLIYTDDLQNGRLDVLGLKTGLYFLKLESSVWTIPSKKIFKY